MGIQIGNINLLPFVGDKIMDLPRKLGQREWKPWDKLQANGLGVGQCGTGTLAGTTMQLCASGHVSSMTQKNQNFLRLDSTGSSEVSSEICETPDFMKNLNSHVPEMTFNMNNHHIDHRHVHHTGNYHQKNTLFRRMYENKPAMPHFPHPTYPGIGKPYSSGSNWNNLGRKPYSYSYGCVYPPSQPRYPMEPGYCNGVWYSGHGYPVNLMDPIVYMGIGPNMNEPPSMQYSSVPYNDMSSGHISNYDLGKRCQPNNSQGSVYGQDHHPMKSNMKSKLTGVRCTNADPIIDSMTHLHITSVKSPHPARSCTEPQTSCGKKPDISCDIRIKPAHDVMSSIPYSSSASSKGLNVHAKVFQCRKNSTLPPSSDSHEVNSSTLIAHPKETTQTNSLSVINQSPMMDTPKCTSHGKKPLHVTVSRATSGLAASKAGPESCAPKMIPSSQKKKRRPSCKKRRRLKLQRNVETHAKSEGSQGLASEQCASKRQKTKHGHARGLSDDSSSSGLSRQSSLSAVAILLDLDEQSSDEGHDLGDSVKDVTNEFPVFNAKFSFFISSSDSDFSEDDWEDEESSEIDSSSSRLNDLDQELWNSFHRDDPLNPLNLHISYQISEDNSSPKMTKSYSSPEIGSPDQLESLNALWNIKCTISPKPTHLSPVSSLQKAETCKKKVHFADGPELVIVHPLEASDEDSEESRKGPWEQYALDRSRFQNRIQDVDKAIGHVFQSEHRTRMFRQLHS